MKKLLIPVICLILASMGAAHAVTLSLDPQSLVIPPSTTFDITLKVSDVPLGQGIGAFDVDIKYDPSQVEFKQYSLGTLLGDYSLSTPEAIDASSGISAPGVIDLAELSLLDPATLVSLQSNAFDLAVLTFHCLQPGKSLIEIDPSDPLLTVGDEFGNPYAVTVGNPVQITQTPEPSSLILLGVGCVGFILARKKMRV